jgi:hypothetical protein
VEVQAGADAGREAQRKSTMSDKQRFAYEDALRRAEQHAFAINMVGGARAIGRQHLEAPPVDYSDLIEDVAKKLAPEVRGAFRAMIDKGLL